MAHLLAVPDKFRGTASAPDLARAMAESARTLDWTAEEAPMSDGGEGLLDTLGGDVHRTEVPGPLGLSTVAEWRMRHDRDGPVAVIEMSRAAGRALLPHPTADDAVRADTTGVGLLLVAARDAGARRIVIGCGGSATTDGGWGAVQAVGTPGALADVDLVVACDVTTAFGQAAALFGPQKGASPDQVVALTERLASLSEYYRRHYGVDVDALPGAGAAGGLAGGLAAIGASLEPGFDLVAGMIGLAEKVRRSDLVVTGEGHLDPPSFHGKVPGGVLELARGHCLVLCIVGGADRGLVEHPPEGMRIVSLTHRFGPARAREETIPLVAQVTAEEVARFCP